MVTAEAWVTAVARVQSLAQELPHAMSAAKKKKKKKKVNSIIINAGEGVQKKREPSYAAGRNVNGCSH